MIKALKEGIGIALNQKRTALFIYLVQLIISLMIGMQVFQVLDSSIGNSLILDKLSEGFNRTILTDFMYTHGASISPLIGLLRWLIIVYLLIIVFVNAGTLYNIIRRRSDWKSLTRGGFFLWLPFMKLALFFVLILLIWSALLWIPALNLFSVTLDAFNTEKPFVWLLLTVIVVFILGTFFLWIWSTLSRIVYLKFNMQGLRIARKETSETGSSDEQKISDLNSKPHTVWKCIKTGLSLTIKNIAQLYGLIILFTIIQIILLLVYLDTNFSVGSVNPLIVLLFICMQQAFVFIRIMTRIALVGSIVSFYESKQKI